MTIAEKFARIGDFFAADTETALAPKCFQADRCVCSRRTPLIFNFPLT